MVLRIQYPDKRYDYVSAAVLDRLIFHRSIKKFFRPYEDRWVDIDLDPVRGDVMADYIGRERRESGSAVL